MKKMKKKISIWKVASIVALVTVSGAMFACEEELEAGIAEIVEESSQQTQYSDEVQAKLEQAQALNPGQKFTVIETILENGESIAKLQEYDPDQITSVIVEQGEKEGDGKITLIVEQSSDLFRKTMELQEVREDEVFTIVEKPATFSGGENALTNYLGESIKYPKQAQELGIEGTVFVEFIVQPDGKVTDAKVVKGIGAGCDKIALNVIKDSPNWEPALHNGKPVKQRLIQNIQFKLPE